jgi:hypothetical protein
MKRDLSKMEGQTEPANRKTNNLGEIFTKKAKPNIIRPRRLALKKERAFNALRTCDARQERDLLTL